MLFRSVRLALRVWLAVLTQALIVELVCIAPLGEPAIEPVLVTAKAGKAAKAITASIPEVMTVFFII